jgi:hypothetical protein
MAEDSSSTEYVVTYDAVDGATRTANALDKPGVQQIIADLHEDENRRQLLAQSVGLTVDPHDYNFSITEVTTTTKPAKL